MGHPHRVGQLPRIGLQQLLLVVDIIRTALGVVVPAVGDMGEDELAEAALRQGIPGALGPVVGGLADAGVEVLRQGLLREVGEIGPQVAGVQHVQVFFLEVQMIGKTHRIAVGIGHMRGADGPHGDVLVLVEGALLHGGPGQQGPVGVDVHGEQPVAEGLDGLLLGEVEDQGPVGLAGVFQGVLDDAGEAPHMVLVHVGDEQRPDVADQQPLAPHQRLGGRAAVDEVERAVRRLVQGGFTVVYAGNLGNTQNVGVILDAAQFVPLAHFVIFGTGGAEDDIRSRIERDGLLNVSLLPLQPVERVSHVYSLGDACIVSCKPGLGGSAMPSKTWSIMSCGRPVIASFDEGELKDIIEKNDCGLFAHAGNVDEFVDAIRTLSQNKEMCYRMGSNARQFILDNLTKEVGTKKYVEVIKSFEKK